MLNLNQIGVNFGERTLFENISLAIGNKDRVGLVGRNGAGKTTLLKIIAGIQNPSEGTVSTPKEYRIGYLPQEMEHNEDATILEEAQSAFAAYQDLEAEVGRISAEIAERTDYESDTYTALINRLSEANDQLALMGTGTKEEQTQRILQGLGFRPADMGRKMNEFSGGWKMRVELGKLLLIAPDLLLLDEPTNHLDIESIEWFEGFLKTYPGAMVLISHDRTFLDNITDRTVEITSTRVHDHKASYSKYMQWREEEFERQEQAAKQQQKDIAHTQELINKFRAKKNKAAFAQTLIRKLDKIERIEVDQFENAEMKFRFPPAPRAGKVVVEAKGLRKRFDDLEVFRDVDLMIARQDKVALVGKNGAGKTTLTRILLGELEGEGKCGLGHNVDFGYYAQNQSDELDGRLTVFETIDNEAEGEVRKKVRALLGAFLFSGEDVDKKVKVLSGGEKARLALCKLLLHPYNLLVLDEPTNHLDMKAKDVLKQALVHYDGTLIVVSHDRDFLTGLTDLVYEVTPTGLRQYIGDIQQFLIEKRSDTIAAYEAGRGDGPGGNPGGKDTKGKTKATAKAESKEQGKQAYADQKAIRKLKNRIGKLEKQVAELEGREKQLNEEMAALDPDDRMATVEKAYEFEKVQTALQDALNEWESTTRKLEKLESGN